MRAHARARACDGEIVFSAMPSKLPSLPAAAVMPIWGAEEGREPSVAAPNRRRAGATTSAVGLSVMTCAQGRRGGGDRGRRVGKQASGQASP